MHYSRVCLALLLLSLGGGALAITAAAPQPLVRIDHIPLAVRDLDRAAMDYRHLGFTIKPGRFHADGIRNMHVKFSNGAGIELITAAAPGDALTRQYRVLLAQGEGPAFVGFYTPDLRALERRLAAAGIAYTLEHDLLVFPDPALAWAFVFGTPNLAPNDKPEYFRHPNTAGATLGIWIAVHDEAPMLRLFRALGAHIERKTVFAPDPVSADIATVSESGKVIFLPASRQILPGRRIVGIILQTKHLDALARKLRAAGVVPAATRQTRAYRSVFLGPRDTHGVWLEFREPGRMHSDRNGT